MRSVTFSRLRGFNIGFLVAGAVAISGAITAGDTWAAAPSPQKVSVVTAVNGVIGGSAPAGALTTVSFSVTNQATNGSLLAGFAYAVPPGLGQVSSVGPVSLAGVFAPGRWIQRVVPCKSYLNSPKLCSAIVEVSAVAPLKPSAVPANGTVTASISFYAPTKTGALSFPLVAVGNGLFSIPSPAPSITVGPATSTVLTVTAPSSFTAGVAQNVTVKNPAFTGGSVTFTITGDDAGASIGGAPFGAGKTATVVIPASSVSGGQFILPARFTTAQNQNLTVTSGAFKGSSAPFAVTAAPAVVTITGITDTSHSPGSSTPVAGGTFSTSVTVADSFGNPYSGVTATLSAPNAVGGSLTPASPSSSTDTAGAAVIVSSYSSAQNGLQLLVSAAGTTGSKATDIANAGGATATGAPNVALPPTTIPTSTGSATFNLPNGAFGPVSLTSQPTNCTDPLLPAGYACDAASQTVTLDLVATQGTTHLYSPSAPASLSLTCNSSACPQPALPAGPGAGAIASGFGHTCALRSDHTVVCWGSNSAGQLGSASGANALSPVVVPGISTAAQITAGEDQTCALLADRSVQCWGQGYGATPVAITGIPGLTQISTSGAHTCGVAVDTGVWCWGSNTTGQFGNGYVGTTTNEPPAPVYESGSDIAFTGATSVVAFSAYGNGNGLVASGSTCALKMDGSVWCWGDNTYGQLGQGGDNGGYINGPSLVHISNATSGAALNASGLTAGGSSVCATIVGNELYCWGDNRSGQLGTDPNSYTTSATPLRVAVPTDGTITSVAMSADIGGTTGHTCATESINNSVYCWGANADGQTGSLNYPGGSYLPTYVPWNVTGAAIQPVSVVSAGRSFTCGIFNDWMIQCWGLGVDGQLGDSNGASDTYPRLVAGTRYDWQLAEYNAYPVLVSLKVGGTYQSYGSARPCSFPGGQTVGAIVNPAVLADAATDPSKLFCVDVYAISRDATTNALTRPILFVEDPKTSSKP